MAIHWQIPFMSLRAGTAYTVNIYDAAYSGNPVVLRGSAQPFTTEEDDNDDMFTPVRTQTGYIRIVDNGLAADGTTAFDWKTLLPATDTSIPVTLTHVSGGATVVDWQGFMQSQNFGATLYGNPQEREYPIQCPLAAVDGEDIVNSTDYVTGMKNFAFYLKRILDCVYEKSSHILDYDNIYVQGGTYAQDALKKLIDPQVLADVDEDENTIEANYNMLEVMEDICRYWGWTARTSGRNLVLTGVGFSDNRFLPITKAQLAAIANGDAVTVTPIDPSTPQIGNVFASMNNEATMFRGASKAIVNADAGDSKNNEIELYPDYVEEQMPQSLTPAWVYEGARMVFVKEATSIDGINLAGSTYGRSRFLTARMYTPDVGHDVLNDPIKPVIYIGPPPGGSSAEYDGSTRATVSTKFEHNYAACVLELEADTYFGGKRMTAQAGNFEWGSKYMYVCIGIVPISGTAKWFNGTSWQTTKTTVKITICNETSKLYYKVADSADLHRSYIEVPNADGYYGKLQIDFLGTTDPIIWAILTGNHYEFALSGFKVSFGYGTATFGLRSWQDGTKKANVATGNVVDEEWQTDCIYCSYNKVKYGYGVLADSQGKPMILTQEQNLAQRVAAYLATAKRHYSTDLLANDAGVAAITATSEASIDNTSCYPVSIGREWRDDVAQINLIQK